MIAQAAPWIRGYRGIVLWVVLASIALLWSYSTYTAVNLEDAFITYRYARNLAQGDGFVFNPGERVLGTTSPLYGLLLAALSQLFGVSNLPDISAFLTMSCGVAAVGLTAAFLLRATASRTAALVAAGVLLTSPIAMLTMCGGMETSLVLLLMVGGIFSASEKRWVFAGVLSGLLVLARIDGCAWAGLVLFYSLLQSGRGAIVAAVAAGACVLPAAAFALWYYGSPIPHSAVAKYFIGFERPSVPFYSWARMQKYARWVAEGCRCAPTGVLGLLASFGIVGLARRRSRHSPLWIFAVFPVCYLAALYLGRAPTDFEWYLTPVVLCVSVLAGLGADQLVSLVRGSRLWQEAPAAGVALIGLLVMSVGVAAVKDASWEFHRSKLFQSTLETGLRRPAGEWLRDHTPPGASVAMEAIGYQGYFSERRVIDLAGLVSPDVVRIGMESSSNAEAFRRILDETRPGYVLLRSFEADNNWHWHGGRLFRDAGDRETFFARYKEMARFTAPRDLGPLSRLTVYGLKSSQPAPDNPETDGPP